MGVHLSEGVCFEGVDIAGERDQRHVVARYGPEQGCLDRGGLASGSGCYGRADRVGAGAAGEGPPGRDPGQGGVPPPGGGPPPGASEGTSQTIRELPLSRSSASAALPYPPRYWFVSGVPAPRRVMVRPPIR